jgi:glycosyltransferase involved in cell wall biosynthesis
MTAYNAEATLPETVGSVLAQTVGDLELIVADDASQTPVSEVLADVRDPRLRIVCRKRNGGTGRGRNTALRHARAPLVAQLDADDLWEPGYVEAMLPLMNDPTVGLAYCNATILGHPEGHEDYIGDPSIHPRHGFPEIAEANPIPCPTATMRTQAVRAIGGYAGWLWSVEDWNLYMRLAAAGWRFAYLHERLARYRWPTPERGMSYDTARLERWAVAALLDVWIRHPRTPGPPAEAARRARRLVRGNTCAS